MWADGTLARSLVHLWILCNVIPPQRLVPIPLPPPLQREIPCARLPAPLPAPHAALLPPSPLPEVPLGVRRQPHLAREGHDAGVQELAPRADAGELRAPEEEEPEERDERAEGRHRVLDPPQREPHDERHRQRGERRAGPAREHREQPDGQPGPEPVRHLVLRNLVEGVPDWPGLLVSPHCEAGGDEHRRPEGQPWEGDEGQEGEPGRADDDPIGHECARDHAADAVIFDTDMNQEVLIFLNGSKKS
jgi:hypothetical protein